MKSKSLNHLFLLFLLIVFFVGLYLYVFEFSTFREGMVAGAGDSAGDRAVDSTECPDLLVNQGNVILLYNSKLPEAKGTNPLEFKNMDEYILYLEGQRKVGKKCPVLYLQLENDAQGNDMYRVRPSPFDTQGGLQTPLVNRDPTEVIDSNRDHPPYNSGNYAGFDPMGLHVGEYTVLDQIHESTEQAAPISDNPLDSNWGGVLYTESAIQSGKYEDRVVTRPNYITPKGGIQF